MFIIRDMAFGGLLGEPFNGPRVHWHGVPNAFTDVTPLHGAEYRPGSIVLQKVYEIVDLPPTGSGSTVVYGTPTYDAANDRVTRTVTKSQSEADIRAEATAWVRNRRAGYKSEVLALKGFPEGSEIDGLGFVMDAMIGEMVARGVPVTAEFIALLQKIAAVKAANPKP